jgi:hypothetical protein
MKLFNTVILIFSCFALIFSSCKDTKQPDVILPKEYLPAYPGSYWDYTDGTRSRVEPQYEEHSYRESANSTSYSEACLVSVIDGKYLYEYSVYQSSPIYPLRKLLSDKNENAWVVEDNNGVRLLRHSQSIDSLIVIYPHKDSIFRNIIISVEYIDSLGEDRWTRKEYYAKNVGLIRVDVNNPFDTIAPVIEKEIRTYHINK